MASKIRSIHVLKSGDRYSVGSNVFEYDPESKGAKTHKITEIKDYTVEAVNVFVPVYEVYADNKLYKRVENAELEISYFI